MLRKYRFLPIILLSSLMLLSACSRKILYFQDINIPPQVLNTHYETYRLKPYDYLYISIKTTDKSINELFNQFLQNFNWANYNAANSGSYYLSGYMVNDSGYVYIPLIGAIYAQGKSIEEFERELQQKINQILKEAVVRVKLISYEVYFIGEVNRRVVFYKDRVNILEAISTVGGLPYSANKKQVYIIRRIDSTYKVFSVDLTSKKVMENSNFYLQPYDIIYVQPRPAARLKIQASDYLVYISIISSSISLITFVLTVLSRKS